MADYGMLGGLAEGIKQGLMAYRDERKYRDELKARAEEKALRERMLKIQEAGGVADIYDKLGFVPEGVADSAAGIGQPAAQPPDVEPPAAGLVAPESGFLPRRQRQLNEKVGSLNAGLLNEGKRAVIDPMTGEIRFEDIPLTGRAKDEYERKRSKEQAEVAAKKIETEEKRLKLAETKATTGTVLIPGYDKDPNVKVDDVEVRLLRNAVSDGKKLKFLLNTIKEKVRATDKLDLANPLNSARQNIDQLLNEAQLLYKGEAFAKLGVLAGPDMEILNKVIEDPASIKMLLSNKDELVRRYDDAINRIDRGIGITLETRGFRPAQAAGGKKPPAGPHGPVVIQEGVEYRWNSKTGEYE